MTGLVLLLENLLMPLGAALLALRFLLSPRRGLLANLRFEVRERLGLPLADRLPEDGRARVWLHAASAGEVNAASPLVALLADRGLAVIVTSTTATGRQRAKGLPGVAAAFLAPLDCWPAVAAFLNRVKPSTLIVMETELWPHMLHLSGARGLKRAVVNARMTERAYGRYRLFAPLARRFVSTLELVAAQTPGDAERYAALGAPYVVVTGNMKHDAPGAGHLPDQARAAFVALGWGDAPVFCAGSTHPGEEEEVAAAYLRAKSRHPSLKLLIAPRHVERAAGCAETLAKLGVAHCALSAPRPGADAAVVDRLGYLAGLYAFSAAAFVGGTLVPVGGHNVLEPAQAGVPVLFGPHYAHTADVARLLESAGGALCVQDGPHLAQVLTDLLADPARAKGIGGIAKKAAEGLRGAAARTIKELSPLLP